MKRRLFASAGYALAALMLVVVVVKPGAVSVARSAILGHAAGASDQIKAAEQFIAGVRNAHRTADPFLPAGATLVIGDSLAMGFPADALGPLAVNYGIGWQRTDQLLESMAIYRSMDRAARVVVFIGTNNALQKRTQGVEAEYRAILGAVPPRVPVTLIGPSPVPGAELVAKAARAACAADSRCTFVDGTAVLSKPGMLGPDRIHPSREGYAELLQVLTTHRAG